MSPSDGKGQGLSVLHGVPDINPSSEVRQLENVQRNYDISKGSNVVDLFVSQNEINDI